MKSCKWKKVKFKTSSLSEWACETCGQIGYASHEKPPVTCLRPGFGSNFKSSKKGSASKLERFGVSKLGRHGFSVPLVFCLIAPFVIFSHFKCDIYFLLGFESSICSSIDLVDEIYKDNASDGLSETDAKTNVCTSFDYVDYADVEEYLGMLRQENAFLESAISDSVQEYRRSYDTYLELADKRLAYFKEKIEKCFGGDRGEVLSLEVARMNNYVHEKSTILYDLAFK